MTTQALTTTADTVIVGTPMMDADEAREYLKMLRWDLEAADQALTNFCARAVDFTEREGWRALGYAGAIEALQTELGAQYSKSYLSRILQAGEIERVLELPIGQLPERTLRPLARLDTPDQQRQAYQAVQGKPTAAKVQQAVDQIRSLDLPPDLIAAGVRLIPHGTWFKIAGLDNLNDWAKRAQPFDQAVETARTLIAFHPPPAPIETDDSAIIAQIRSQAAALGLGVVWEDDTVILHWPDEDIDQLIGIGYTDALYWLAHDGVQQAQARAAQPDRSPRAASATVAAYDVAERADREILTEATGMLSAARALLSSVAVATWRQQQVDTQIVREQGRAFLLTQRDRLTRFSPAAMVSQATFTEALDHIAALLEVSE